MFSKSIIQKSQQNLKLYKYLNSQYRIYNFSSQNLKENEKQQLEQKLSKKKLKKLQEEEQIESIRNYETIAMQNEYTQDKLNEIVDQRKKQILEISKQKNIPTDALITGLLVTSPMVFGSIALNYMCLSGIMLSSIPLYSIMYAKYSAINLCFGAGVHWGFAMSMHDMQFDSINSSPEARKHFILSCVPMFSTISIVNTLCYTQAADPSVYVASVGLLSLLHGYNLFLDKKVVNDGQAPQWFFTMKLILTILSLAGLGGYGYLHQFYPDLMQQKDFDPLRQHIPNQTQILQESLKLSTYEEEQKQQSNDQIKK